jgi:hypothetical protein
MYTNARSTAYAATKNCALATAAESDDHSLLVADVVAEIGAATAVRSTDSPSAPDGNVAFHQMQLLVQHQQGIIHKLQNQLNYILSFPGIDGDNLTFNIEQDNNERRQPPSISPNTPVVGTESLSFLNALPSWSEVVRRKQPRNQVNNFQPPVVAVVYMGQSMN